MKQRKATWDPLEKVGKVVDTLLEPPRNKGGRPRAEGRGRLVLYLDEQQIYKLKRDALEKRKDVSTLAREVLRKAGY